MQIKEVKEKHLKEISSYFTNKFHVDALLLVGSHVHDEGMWIRINNQWFTSDYDIIVITEKQVSLTLLKEIKEDLRLLCPILVDFWIQTRENFFKKMLLEPFYGYQQKNRHRILAGDPGFAKKMPNIEICGDKITPFIHENFFKRFFNFLYPLGSLKFLEKKDAHFKEYPSLVFKYFMIKMVVDGCIPLEMLFYGELESKTKDSLEKLQYYLGEKSNKLKFYKWAFQEKMRPSLESMSAEEKFTLYKRVFHYYLEAISIC